MWLVVGSLRPMGTGDSPFMVSNLVMISAAMSATAWAGVCDWYLSRLTCSVGTDRCTFWYYWYSFLEQGQLGCAILWVLWLGRWRLGSEATPTRLWVCPDMQRRLLGVCWHRMVGHYLSEICGIAHLPWFWSVRQTRMGILIISWYRCVFRILL